MRRRSHTAALIAALAAGAALLPSTVAAQAEPVGVWNIRSRDMTDRATGGVRVVLLRVERAGGGLAAEITSIRNTFMPVDELTYERGTLRVVHGSYAYNLRIQGDELTGTLESPLGTQEVEGVRQHETLTYVGDEADPFRTTRPGVLGHRTLLEPPAQEPDPAGWVRSRIESVDDLALVVGRRAKVAIPFTNAREHEAVLLRWAGQPVTVVGVWVGEAIRIEAIEPGTP
ncbi:MAG TPA: hypothetical protein VMM35_13020 [Longimicrobiales bacterium]|nr:hypothetical protein [Longimicrobiales bacterium]